MRIILENATILSGTEFEVLDSGHLILEDGKILQVGAGPAPSVEGRRLDAAGTIICPAFINAHTHISDAIAKELGFSRPHWEAVMPPDGIRFRCFRETSREVFVSTMHDTMAQMVENGISTFVDFREGGLDGVQVMADVAAHHPIRAMSLGRFGNFPPQPPEQVSANEGGLSDERKKELSGILQVAAGFSCVSANDLTDQSLEELGQIVRDHSRIMAIHVAESPEYRETSRKNTGKGDVERVLSLLKPHFIVHLTDATEEELDQVAAAGVPVVVCPRIQGVMGLGFPRFDRMLERGIPVALATDNVFLAAPDILKELDYASRSMRGLRKDPTYPDAREMLKMITVYPAQIIGRGDELGSIEAGRIADLVLFDAGSRNLRPVHDPVATIVNRADVRDIRAVLHEGKLVKGDLPSA